MSAHKWNAALNGFPGSPRCKKKEASAGRKTNGGDGWILVVLLCFTSNHFTVDRHVCRTPPPPLPVCEKTPLSGEHEVLFPQLLKSCLYANPCMHSAQDLNRLFLFPQL